MSIDLKHLLYAASADRYGRFRKAADSVYEQRTPGKNCFAGFDAFSRRCRSHRIAPRPLVAARLETWPSGSTPPCRPTISGRAWSSTGAVFLKSRSAQ